MFETSAELSELQSLLETSYERMGQRMHVTHEPGERLSAEQLAGFRGIRLVAIANVNKRGEPRVSPRAAAFLHGKFYLAADTESVMVQRVSANPNVAISYFENHFLLIGHGSASLHPKDGPEFKRVSPEWKKAFNGGRDALRGVNVFLRIDATQLVAFAPHPERYPAAWGRPPAR
jgi:Pyridoxamine 5'-phosphate oxidase